MKTQAAMPIVLMFIAMLGRTAPAAAQGESRVTIGIGGMYSLQQSQPAASTDPGYPQPGIGGSAFGVIVDGTVALSPIVDLGFEFSDPARLEALQTTTGFLASQTDNQHRDLIISELVHFHERQRNAHAVKFDEVVGFSWIRESTLQRRAYAPAGSSGPYSAFGPKLEIARTTFGLTGGIDIDFAAGRHVSVVPQFRLHWIAGDDDNGGSSSALLHLDPLVLRAALTVRARF